MANELDSELMFMAVWYTRDKPDIRWGFEKTWNDYQKRCVVNPKSREKLKYLFELRVKDPIIFERIKEDAAKEYEKVFKKCFAQDSWH